MGRESPRLVVKSLRCEVPLVARPDASIFLGRRGKIEKNQIHEDLAKNFLHGLMR